MQIPTGLTVLTVFDSKNPANPNEPKRRPASLCKSTVLTTMELQL